MKKIAIALVALSMMSLNVYASHSSTPPAEGHSMKSSTPGKQAGEAFLTQNKAKAGVVTLPDGLQYKIVTKGSGVKPTINDTVSVNYEGTFIDGKVFDSSYKRGEPATFPLSAVIPGWTEALQLMSTGSTWMLYIPASLAYGEQGMPPVIGPSETLVFKVELLAIEKKA